MARLLDDGFETQLLKAEADTSEGAPVISTAQAHSGLASLEITGSVRQNIAWEIAGVLGRAYFARVWFRSTVSKPTNTVQIADFENTEFGDIGFVRFNTNGTLTLHGSGGVQIGVATAAISANTWYCVELKVRVAAVPTSSNGLVEGRLDGEVFATSSATNVGLKAVKMFRCANASSTIGGSVFIDDVAVNDDQGENQNGYPGIYGKIVMCKSFHDFSRVGFVAGGGGTLELFKALQAPPKGVALASATNTSQVKDAENNATDTLVEQVNYYSEVGINPTDKILLCRAIARGANSTTTSRTLAVSGALNPEIAEGTAATGATAGATEPTGWTTVRTAYVYNPVVNMEGAVEVKVRKGTASTDSLMYDFIGLSVEYEPITVFTDSGGGTATMSGSGTESAAAVDSAGATATASGPGADSFEVVDTGSGTVSASGEGSETTGSADSGEGTVIGSGKGTESTGGADSGTGTVTSSGSAVEIAYEQPARLRVNERPPMRQYILATTPGGRTYRWGEDESYADRVIEDLSDSDAVPGGHTTLTGSLARKPGVDYGDMKMGTKIEVFGAGQMKVSEYRLERAPRTSGDKLIMEPAANGYQVLLSDNEGARCIPIDADMSAWGEPSAARRVAFPTSKINQNGQVALLPAGDPKGGSVPAISHSWAQMNTSVGSVDDCESWYDSSGIGLGRIMLDFLNVKGGSGGSWATQVYAVADDTSAGLELLKDFNATTASNQSFTIAADKFFLLLYSVYNATFTGEGNWEDQYRNIRIQDRSGIPVYGTWPEVGVLASDVLTYILSQFAPGLSFTTGPSGSLKPTSFLIPHLAFKDPTTLLEMITQALRFELLEWGVWPGQSGPTFYLNQRGQREGRKRWRARVRPAKLTETGQQMDQVWNKVVVSWPDVDGTTKTIGPPGSGYALTSTSCEDTDPLNPINEAGESRTKHLALNNPATQRGAEETAQRFLEQAKLLDGSGEATLTGFVEDEHGMEWPYYHVKAGDEIEFLDSSIPGYRYIVEASRSRKSRSVQIHIDAPPDSYAALLERIGVREVPLGLGA